MEAPLPQFRDWLNKLHHCTRGQVGPRGDLPNGFCEDAFLVAFGTTCAILDASLDPAGLAWLGWARAGLGWLGWVGWAGWAGLAGLGWAGLGWARLAGLGWAGWAIGRAWLGWAGFGWG